MPSDIRMSVAGQMMKVDKKLIRTTDFFYKKGAKPSEVSLPKQIQQQEKAYTTNKVMDFFSDKQAFHKPIEIAQEFKNF